MKTAIINEVGGLTKTLILSEVIKTIDDMITKNANRKVTLKEEYGFMTGYDVALQNLKYRLTKKEFDEAL